MKKILIAFISVVMLNLSCAAQAQKEKDKPQKILVAYYSWSGNTQELARQIQTLTQADIFEIKPVTPYPEDYSQCVQQAKQEIADHYKPELNGTVKNMEQYDVIFVGSPNWWSTIAPPVATFLTSYHFEGKTVIPFCTHGSGGRANLFIDMAKWCPDCTMLEGFAVNGKLVKESSQEVKEWLKGLGIIK